jgi:hypothetical protein
MSMIDDNKHDLHKSLGCVLYILIVIVLVAAFWICNRN